MYYKFLKPSGQLKFPLKLGHLAHADMKLALRQFSIIIDLLEIQMLLQVFMTEY